MSKRLALWPVCCVLALMAFALVPDCRAASGADAAPEQTVSAGPLQATLKLDRASLNVAENLVATLCVKAPAGVQVVLPPAETKLGGFSVVSMVDEPLRTVLNGAGEQQEMVRRYTLEPFLPGEYTFPALEIRWKKSGGESGVARTAEVTMPITSLLPKQTAADAKAPDPGTIRGEYTAPKEGDSGALWAGIGIGFGAAVAIGGGLWVWTRRRQTTDAIDRLLQRIDDLRLANHAGVADPDALHELAGALRGAFAERVEPAAASADANELAKTLEMRTEWGETEARRAGQVLSALDAARFSGSPMPASEFGQHVETVRGILERLRAVSLPAGVRR